MIKPGDHMSFHSFLDQFSVINSIVEVIKYGGKEVSFFTRDIKRKMDRSITRIMKKIIIPSLMKQNTKTIEL